jgi:hypothetical protein
MTPKNAQRLLREFLDEANDLARTPRFYNTPTSNCTTLVFEMVRVIHPGLPLDVRVILAGYLPNYAYAVGATDTSASFEKLRELSRIHEKALRADDDPDFSARIGEGILVPIKLLGQQNRGRTSGARSLFADLCAIDSDSPTTIKNLRCASSCFVQQFSCALS